MFSTNITLIINSFRFDLFSFFNFIFFYCVLSNENVSLIEIASSGKGLNSHIPLAEWINIALKKLQSVLHRSQNLSHRHLKVTQVFNIRIDFTFDQKKTVDRIKRENNPDLSSILFCAAKCVRVYFNWWICTFVFDWRGNQLQNSCTCERFKSVAPFRSVDTFDSVTVDFSAKITKLSIHPNKIECVHGNSRYAFKLFTENKICLKHNNCFFSRFFLFLFELVTAEFG